MLDIDHIIYDVWVRSYDVAYIISGIKSKKNGNDFATNFKKRQVNKPVPNVRIHKDLGGALYYNLGDMMDWLDEHGFTLNCEVYESGIASIRAKQIDMMHMLNKD